MSNILTAACVTFSKLLLLLLLLLLQVCYSHKYNSCKLHVKTILITVMVIE